MQEAKISAVVGFALGHGECVNRWQQIVNQTSATWVTKFGTVLVLHCDVIAANGVSQAPRKP